MAPLVSVITPTYQSADTVRNVGRTLVEQTFGDWEWVVVDDGSTDSTTSAVGELADPRTRLIVIEHRGIPSYARNLGAALAKGSYLAFLDADDLCHPARLERQLQFFRLHPETSLVHSNVRLVDGTTGSLSGRGMRLPSGCLQSGDGALDDLAAGNHVYLSTVMIRRDVFLNAGGFRADRELMRTADYELWLRLASKGAVFGFVDEPLVDYCDRAGSMSKSFDEQTTEYVDLVDRLLRDAEWLNARRRRALRRLRARVKISRGVFFLTQRRPGYRLEFGAAVRSYPCSGQAWKWLLLSALPGSPLSRIVKWRAKRIAEAR